MSSNVTFISSKKEFEESQKLISNLFRLDQQLPEQVFGENLGNFVFSDFDWAMSFDFWETIRELAEASQDAYILTAVLEPNPIDYFYYEFGYYNWVKLPISISADDYWEVLQLGPKDSPADAMLFNSFIVVWVSPSMKWAVWGDRTYGICIFASEKGSNIINHSSLLGTWKTVNEALTDLLPINFKSRQMPIEFSSTLRSNYFFSHNNK
jgi:hypothetical protein